MTSRSAPTAVCRLVTELARSGALTFAKTCERERVPRQLRIDYAGAVQHIIVRGVARSIIAVDAADYEYGLFILERTVSAFELRCHAWTYMPNHTHLLVTSELGNVSHAMQSLGTRTAQWFNRRHGRSGHLFQGRFGSRLVETEKHLLELARYLPLNPVRAGLCDSPEAWPWSSYAATVGLQSSPRFLDPRAFTSAFASTDAYVAWVTQGVDASFLDDHGSPKPAQRSPSLAELLVPGNLDAGIAAAYLDHHYRQTEIARHLGMSTSQVSRRLARHQQSSRTA